ncbi:MAG: hypothetical protein WBW49_15530, partial [Candidatus Acidiferrum sp.]
MEQAITNGGDKPLGMSERMRVALLVAVTALVYANSLRNGFTLDDNLYILTNPMMTHFSLKALFAPVSYNNIFRPVTFGSFALNWMAEGEHPFGYHLVNLLLHVAVTVLLYLVLRKLLEKFERGGMAAWVAALLFAVHPLHTEAVASISGRSELLAMGFVLGAWLLHMNDWPVLAVVAFALAMLSKESALAFAPLAIAGDYVRGQWKPLWRYGLIGGAAVAYLGLLWKAQGGRFGAPGVTFLDNPLVYLPVTMRIANALRIGWKYVWLQVYPVMLSCDYSYNQIILYANWHRNVLAILATAVVVGVWLWALWSGRREWFLAGAIYLAGFAITANILTPTGTIFGERLAYLPSAGFCLLVALVWVRLEKRANMLAWGVLALLVLGCGVRTMARNRDWRDNVTLFTAGLKASPRSAKMHSNQALQYYWKNDLDAASRELEIALRIYPDMPDTIGYQGLIAARKGNDQEAQRLLEKALSMTLKSSPNWDFISVNLAAVKMKQGKNDDALK